MENWTRWASLGASTSAPLSTELKFSLDSILLTEDGVIITVMSLNLDDPSSREAALGPAGAA